MLRIKRLARKKERGNVGAAANVAWQTSYREILTEGQPWSGCCEGNEDCDSAKHWTLSQSRCLGVCDCQSSPAGTHVPPHLASSRLLLSPSSISRTSCDAPEQETVAMVTYVIATSSANTGASRPPCFRTRAGTCPWR
ncbi:hypothetical protein Bbelb_077590 [Branchiostoma belcheri]|nr:hypothetical protein Bbelb_077590 [Branchiostoma belcheri]